MTDLDYAKQIEKRLRANLNESLKQRRNKRVFFENVLVYKNGDVEKYYINGTERIKPVKENGVWRIAYRDFTNWYEFDHADLVLSAFCGANTMIGLFDIIHKNGNIKDNRLSNLDFKIKDDL